VHYHFGGRDDLLRALFARSIPAIAERRRALLEVAAGDPTASPRSAADAIVRPITELATRGWRERAYLQIGSELLSGRQPLSRPLRTVLGETEGPAAWTLLRQRLRPVDNELWRARQEICIVLVAGAAAERAWRLDQGGAVGILDDARFVGNLIEMVVAAMGAPEPVG
jgi:AcrR family transcriptional regulator